MWQPGGALVSTGPLGARLTDACLLDNKKARLSVVAFVKVFMLPDFK